MEENIMHTLVLNYIGKDSFSRPIYEYENRLFVDVEPRKDREPNICTVLNNIMGGEPDTPISVMKKYEDVEIEFSPKRITWY